MDNNHIPLYKGAQVHINGKDDAEAVSMPSKGTEISVANQVTDYNNKEDQKMSSICNAMKNDNTRCEIKAKDLGLCGTHVNKLMRDGHIMLYTNEIVIWEDEDTKIAVTNEVATSNNNNEEKEENTMNEYSFIYHFLTEKVEEGVTVMPRILTNIPWESEKTRYMRSVTTHRPVDSLLAIDTGNWLPWLLQKRLADKGIGFRIMILTNREIREISPAVVAKYHERSTFSYANDGHTLFIRIEGADWGLGALGLVEKDVAKITKRLTEITRLSELAYYNETMDINMVTVTPDKDVKYYDGMNSISLKFALKMTKMIPDVKRRNRVRYMLRNGEMVRFNIRVLTPLCLVKGDTIVNPDQVEDLICHRENMKFELRTTGWCMATMSHHNPWHIAVWDDQTWINNRSMLPAEKQRRDVDKTINELKESFNQGVVPDWLLLSEEMHDDSGVPDYDRLSNMLDRQYIYWQAHGLDIRAAQNLIFMATNGLIKRMKRELRKRPERYYRKTWNRMSNAFSAGVMTREFMVDIAKRDIPTNNGYLQFRPEGLVMRGERFATTYDLHGGWDLDDSVKVILIKIWSSDVNRTKLLLESGALDPLCTVRVKETEATHAALLVRSPNGPGEYSIEALDPERWEDLPWHALDLDLIPVVDLAKIPLPQSELLKNVTVTGIPTSITYTGEALTPEQCLAMIEAQRFNPGIGRICNCLMNWAMSFGASFPERMLARLEQMVDTTQQLRDPVSFQAIAEEVDNLYQQMVDKVNDPADPKFVDGLLAKAHPIPTKFAEQMASRMVEGRFTKFNRYFDTRVQMLETWVRDNSFQMRNNVPLVAWVRSLNVSNETLDWAAKFNKRILDELDLNARIWQSPEEQTNPFAAMHYETMRIKANRDTIVRAYEELVAFGPDTTYKKVLGLWHYILKPTKRHPMGGYDRVIFQPGDGERSIMHLLVDALIRMGQANEFTPAQ